MVVIIIMDYGYMEIKVIDDLIFHEIYDSMKWVRDALFLCQIFRCMPLR